MNKLFKIVFKGLPLLALLLIAGLQQAAAQCSFTGPTNMEGCVGSAYNFNATGPDVTPPVDSIVWDFNGVSAHGPSVSQLFSTAGTITVTMKVYKGGNTSPKCTETKNLTIYPLPIPKFVLPATGPQCFKNNKFCFQDQSSVAPGGNPLAQWDYVWQDGGQSTYNSTPPNPLCYSYSKGGTYNPVLRLTDSKGCVSQFTLASPLKVYPDMGIKFTTPNPSSCDTTRVKFTNQSSINQSDVQSYRWVFDDGSQEVGTNWNGPFHTYRDSGCFNAKLIVTSTAATGGCTDTFTKQAACNVVIKLHVSAPNGDVQCASKVTFEHPPVNNASFLWTFDDPPTAILNFDNKKWSTEHDFSSVGPFDVSFKLFYGSCQFDTIYRVHVKGPLATIESKPAVIIKPSERYQCQIKDTVHFPNLSTYYFNDDTALNDFYYLTQFYNRVFQFIEPNKFHINNDTFTMSQIGKHRLYNGDTLEIKTNDTLVLNKRDTLIFTNIFTQPVYLAKMSKDSKVDPFYTKNSHTVRVWDFGDQFAPQCTTDSRPIYPKTAANRNQHFPGTLAPKNTYDANGKWINCAFSMDSLPKHWYTPGHEQCYTVRLKIADTSHADPIIQSLSNSHNDPMCDNTATVQLALRGPDARGLVWEGIPCYGSPDVYGWIYKFDKTQPGCDRQTFWIHTDSLADRCDNTPNVFDKWTHQTGTVVDRLFTPWPLATLGLPPNVGQIFWQYNTTSGTPSYPANIFSRDGWVTIGFRVQNGVDPTTGQPCIDERWYHNAYRYIPTNPAFSYYKPSKPDSLYTFERICKPNDVFVKRDPLAIAAGCGSGGGGTVTMGSDSVGVDIWSWGDGEADVDSFYRWQCIGTKCYSYIKRYKFVGVSSEFLDSIVTRVYDVPTQSTIFLDQRDTAPEILRQHRYNTPGRNVVSHTMITCQMQEYDSVGFTRLRKVCCDNPPFVSQAVAVTSFFSDLRLSDSIVCRNTPIQFFDSARYYLEQILLVPPYIIDAYDYWRDPKHYSDSSNRPKPNPGQYETRRWDFGMGQGFNGSVPQNPIVNYPTPGYYTVKLEFTDSVGCKDVYERTIRVTGVSADFTDNKGLDNCQPIIDFKNLSKILDPCQIKNGFVCDSIAKWNWNFGDNKGSSSTSILKDPKKLYTSFGEFEVQLIVETMLGCKDTISRTITLEGPRPRFNFMNDSVGCVPFTVEFRNESINPKAPKWIWDFGDSTTATATIDSPLIQVHTYLKPGIFEVKLTQTDSTPLGTLPCSATFPDTTVPGYHRFLVKVLPPRPVEFTASDTTICPGDSVTFFSKSDSIYTRFKWILGSRPDTIVNQNVNGKDTIGYRFPNPGQYIVQLRPTYTPPPGEPTCQSVKFHTVYVRDVKADFDVDATSAAPFFKFNDKSKNADKRWWNFDDGNGYVDCNTLPDCPNAKYNYGNKKGTFNVCLVVESPEGCYDTMCKPVENIFDVGFNPPNVFTPNDDGKNDTYDVFIQNEEKYEIFIYNRWGELMFKSEDKNVDWDGKNMNTKQNCPAGVYYVVINYRLRGEPDKTYKGTLTLIR